MADATTSFFESLDGRHEPLLQKVTATVRVELADDGRTERWHLTVEKGDLAVSRRNAPADCIIRADRPLFDRVAAGKQNAMAAVLRGSIRVEGDVELLVLFQRLLPGRRKGRR